MFGNVQTCILDSTAILNESVITFKLQGEKDINTSCQNKVTETYNGIEWWPSWIHFDFKTKIFFYVCNPMANIEKDGSFIYDDGYGVLKYYKKSKTITLFISEFNWQKTYLVDYDKASKLIRLIEKRNKDKIKFIIHKTSKKDNTLKILNKRQ